MFGLFCGQIRCFILPAERLMVGTFHLLYPPTQILLFIFQVLFKLVLGSAKFGEAALFLTIVGGANFVFMSFVPVILYFTHVEYFTSIYELPWASLCGVAGLLLGK